MGTRGRKKGSTLKSKPTIAPTTDKTETISTRSMMTRRSQTRATEKPTDDLKDSKAAEIEPSRKRVRKTVEKKIEEEEEEEIVALHDSDDQQMDDNDDQQEVELIRPQVKLEEAKKNEEEELKQVEETARDDQNVGVQTTTIKLVDPPPAEVFTEASLIAEVNQHLLQSSAPNVLTNPLSQDTSSDSSDSEDAETDDYNDDSGSGSKKSRPRAANGTHRGGTANGVLNKSKIDTEFIAKLIPNKDPNDKRYDLNEINKLRLLSHSYQNFSVKLLTRLFDEEEIIGRNVYGRNYSGDKSATKQPLDPERINFIKETVLRLTKTNNPELAWASCVIAMNRKMVDINNKYAKLKTDRNS